MEKPALPQWEARVFVFTKIDGWERQRAYPGLSRTALRHLAAPENMAAFDVGLGFHSLSP